MSSLWEGLTKVYYEGGKVKNDKNIYRHWNWDLDIHGIFRSDTKPDKEVPRMINLQEVLLDVWFN